MRLYRVGLIVAASSLFEEAMAAQSQTASTAHIAPFVSGTPIPVKVPASPPTGAFHVPPTYLGLSIDQIELLSYSGTGQNPNEFSRNLLNELNKRTESYDTVRIGGTFGDRVVFNASQTNQPVKTNPDGFGWTAGPGFFQGYEQFQDNKITVQMRLGLPENQDLQSSVAFTKRAYDAVGNEKLDSIEIGNEVSGYDNGYTVPDYVKDFKRYGAALHKGIPGLPDGPLYQAGDTASLAAADGDFTVQQMFEAGINSNKNIKVAGEHYYQDKKGDQNLQLDLMSHNAIVERFTNYIPSIQATRKRGLPLILSECGNSLEGTANLSFQAVLGSALWSVDFQMYAMTLGVQRVNWAMKKVGGFSLWLPQAIEDHPKPEVRAPYYAQPFIADFIGRGGTTKVVDLKLGQDRHSAYAAYEHGKLARIALVNLNLWDGSHPKIRPSQKFTIKAPSGQKSVQVRRLTAPEGAYASADTMQWAGQQWTYESQGEAVVVNNEAVDTVAVYDGVAIVIVSASEAAIVSF